MIIAVFGPHASGKSWVVRNVLGRATAKPIYGVLGPRMPEAYNCNEGRFYILGPYHSERTGGVDYITKHGNDHLIAFLDRYSKKGPVLFEASLMSKRFGAPGAWLAARKDALRVVSLSTDWDQCQHNLHTRRATTSAPTIALKGHTEREFKYCSVITKKYQTEGCQVFQLQSKDALDEIWSWLN